MISCVEIGNVYEYRGLSENAENGGDTKPTNATNGSVYLEIDTGDVYIFDGKGKTWRKL